MIDKNSLIPQFESIVSDIKNTTCEIQEFKKSIELCKLVFLNSNLDKNNELISDDSLDIILELKPISEGIIKLLEFLINKLNNEYKDFIEDTKSNINNLNKLKEELKFKNNEYKILKENKKNYELIQKQISRIQIEIDKYEIINIEVISKELIEKEEKLNILKSEKENDLRIWQRHLEENDKIDLNNNEIDILSKEIEEKLKLLDNKIKEEYKGNI